MSCGSNDVNCPQGQTAQNGTCVMNNAGYGYGNGYGYNNGYNNGYGQTGNNNCQTGTFPTQYGCLQRGNCPQNQAFYPQTNQCVQVTSTQYGNGTTGGYQNGGYPNACPNGTIQTYLGCLSQGNCAPGMAYSPQYNTCISAQNTYGNGYGNTYGYGVGFGVGVLYGGCTNGYAYTSYGCLPQGNCPYGMGSFNGYCVH
jgi:hypothetical protein